MHIGVVSPINLILLEDYYSSSEGIPVGYKGATAPSLLVMELLKRGHQISVFTICPTLELGKTSTLYGENLTIYVGSTRSRVKYRIMDFYLHERRFLKNKIIEVNPNILHAHWQYEYAWASIDSKIKTLVTCRDSPIHVFRYQPNLFRFLRFIIAMQVLLRAKYISATSYYLKKNIKLLVVNKKVLIIPNFEPDWLFSLYKYKPDHFQKPHKIVMINNGFGGRKNVSVGIKAFQQYRSNNTKATLHLYGVGFEENGEAHRWSRLNQMDQNIYFHGVKDFKLLMIELTDCHLLIHTALEETFGNILSEAMSLGIPVIGGEKSGAVPWVIGENYKAGILTDIKSPENVADSLQLILNDQETYNLYSVNARMEAVTRFSADNVVTEYENVYNTMIVE
jgi:L-malate glycosyltransferase